MLESSTVRVLLVAVSLALCGCADRPSSSECARLLDHMLKLEIANAGVSPQSAVDLEKQAAQVKESLRDRFMKQCRDSTPGSFVRCALEKSSLNALSECD